MPRRRALPDSAQHKDFEDARGGSSIRNAGRRKGKRALPSEELLEDEEDYDAQESKQGQRRKKKQRAVPAEERLAPFIPRPPSSVRDRIDRAFSHRLYLLDRKLVGSPDAPSACEFFVLGATGNVYTVKLEPIPSCTCPDFERGNTCKHILFVMLRVLKLPRDDPRVWQRALLTAELRDLLRESSLNEAVLATGQLRQQFKQMSGAAESGQAGPTVQREVEGDCAICYEPMAGKDEPVVFCRACGNNVHEDCFKRWSRSKGGGNVTCIYCRAPWIDETTTNKKYKGGYLNLAPYSAEYQSEDTSLQALYPETSLQMWS